MMMGGKMGKVWEPKGPETVMRRCEDGDETGKVGEMEGVGSDKVTVGGMGIGSEPMWEQVEAVAWKERVEVGIV